MLVLVLLNDCSFGFLALLLGWDEEHVDVGENTTGGDGGAACDGASGLGYHARCTKRAYCYTTGTVII